MAIFLFLGRSLLFFQVSPLLKAAGEKGNICLTIRGQCFQKFPRDTFPPSYCRRRLSITENCTWKWETRMFSVSSSSPSFPFRQKSIRADKRHDYQPFVFKCVYVCTHLHWKSSFSHRFNSRRDCVVLSNSTTKLFFYFIDTCTCPSFDCVPKTWSEFNVWRAGWWLLSFKLLIGALDCMVCM